MTKVGECPHCAFALQTDFGLVECPGCGASLLVNFDGSVADPDQSNAISKTPHSKLSYQTSKKTAAPVAASFKADFPEDELPVKSEANYAQLSFDPGGDESENPQSLAALPVDLGSPDGDPQGTSANMGDVVEFANSEASIAKDGIYKYTLLIHGIDTQDLRQEVFWALQDSRFLWNAQSLMKKVRDGDLRLDDISAVKAHLVLKRLAHLPLRVEWIQHAIHQV